MFDTTRFKKRARSLAISVAATSMVVGNVASVAALSSSSFELSDPRPTQTGVTYTFDSSGFSTGTAIQCFEIVFTVNADGTGGTPAGFDASSAELTSSTVITEANWDAGEAHTTGTLQATYGTGETPAASGNFVFTTVTNPNSEDTFFATFTTYTNTDCTTGPTDTVVVAFATTNGVPVSLTIEPALTFTVTGLTASQSVNGATTTADASGSSIDFGTDVTSSTNGVSAHDLDVSTNAISGYTVYIRHTGALTNGSANIDSYTGTNNSPTGPISPGTEAWGYTTSDTTLSAVGDGANRFGSNEWAGFQTSNEEVMFSSGAPTGTDSETVGHQVAISSDTEAGTYTTNIVYTIVATF